MLTFFIYCLITCLCFILSPSQIPLATDNNHLIMVVLISFSLSLLLELLDKRHRYIIYLVFSLLGLIWSPFFYYTPLFLLVGDVWPSSLLALLSLLIHFPSFGLLFLGLLVATCFAYLLKYTQQLKQQLDQQRDHFQEKLLQQKSHVTLLEASHQQTVHIAILTERNRIAKEIHDAIGHTLSSGILQVEALKAQLSPKNLSSLNTLQKTLKEGMFSVRKSLHQLHDSSLDLKAEINQLLDESPMLVSHLFYAINTPLNYQLKHQILSIIKEALTNSRKHSTADKITIKLIEQPYFYMLSIKDNGHLIQSCHPIEKGIGLLSFDEFARNTGGQCHYGSNNGFFIHFVWPIAPTHSTMTERN